MTSAVGASESARTTNLGNRLNRLSAALDFGRQDAAMGQRQGQEADAASARKADARLQAESAYATDTVAAGEAGIAGHTVESLLQDVYAQEGRYDGRTDQNAAWTEAQLQQQKTAASYALKDRQNSFRGVRMPSFVDTGLRIGSAAVNAGTSYVNSQRSRGQ